MLPFPSGEGKEGGVRECAPCGLSSPRSRARFDLGHRLGIADKHRLIDFFRNPTRSPAWLTNY